MGTQDLARLALDEARQATATAQIALNLAQDLEPGPWIQIGVGGAPAWQNGWAGGGGGGKSPAYRINGNIVELRGRMTGGAVPSVAWTMPVEAQPGSDAVMACATIGPDIAGVLTVTGVGAVTPTTGSAVFALDGVSYSL